MQSLHREHRLSDSATYLNCVTNNRSNINAPSGCNFWNKVLWIIDVLPGALVLNCYQEISPPSSNPAAAAAAAENKRPLQVRTYQTSHYIAEIWFYMPWASLETRKPLMNHESPFDISLADSTWSTGSHRVHWSETSSFSTGTHGKRGVRLIVIRVWKELI